MKFAQGSRRLTSQSGEMPGLGHHSPQNALSPRRQFQRTRSFWTSERLRPPSLEWCRQNYHLPQVCCWRTVAWTATLSHVKNVRVEPSHGRRMRSPRCRSMTRQFRLGCIRQCQAQAVRTMVARSESLGSKPNSLRARAGSATSTAGSPALRGPVTSGSRSPASRSIASNTSLTEWPRPVPRLKTPPGPPESKCRRAATWASARSATCT